MEYRQFLKAFLRFSIFAEVTEMKKTKSIKIYINYIKLNISITVNMNKTFIITVYPYIQLI